MRPVAVSRRIPALAAMMLCCAVEVLFASSCAAQALAGAVPITAEPNHKIRFDNGRVRMYEVVLPKGQATLVHEHRADSFAMSFNTAEITDERVGGKAVVLNIAPGTTSFNSTAQGPYAHRVIASGDTTFHVIAMELLAPTPAAARADTPRTGAAFERILENARVSETPQGRPARLWDFEPANFRWCDTREVLSMRNDGHAPIEMVEIEVYGN